MSARPALLTRRSPDAAEFTRFPINVMSMLLQEACREPTGGFFPHKEDHVTFKKALRALTALFALALVWTSGQAAAAPAPAPAPTAAVVLTYDASGAEEFTQAVHNGAAIWNQSVANVRLEPAGAGTNANIDVVADDGWPRALTTSLGNGIIWMGRQAVDEGYDTLRIAAHEFGHILGLPDIKPGPCSSLMSGSSAGTACTNPYPDGYERAAVEDAFAYFAAGAGPMRSAPRLYAD